VHNRTPWVLLLCALFVSAASQAAPQQAAEPSLGAVKATRDEVLSIAAQAKTAAMRIGNVWRRQPVLELIGAVQVASGDWDAALETARQSNPEDTEILRTIGKQLAASTDSKKTESFLRKLEGGGSSSYAFIAKTQAQMGDFEKALRTTSQIQDHTVRSDALDWIAESQAAAGDYSGARKTYALAEAAWPEGHRYAEEEDQIIVRGQLSRGELQPALDTLAASKTPDISASSISLFTENFSKISDKAAVAAWLNGVLAALPRSPDGDIDRYFAIPLQVKLGREDRAMQAATSIRSDYGLRGYSAIGVACAETHNLPCAKSALDKLNAFAGPIRFDAEQMILNVTAALLDRGEFDAAAPWLAIVEEHPDKTYTRPEVDLQRVFFLAKQSQFEDARMRALEMNLDSLTGNQRGTAIRLVALLQTEKFGAAPVKSWASGLPDSEDRAYALVGIAQGLLNSEDANLPYSTLPLPHH